MENTEIIKTEIEGKINFFQNASLLKITDEEQKNLLASFPINEIEIRPDGLIFLPQTFWRKRLNESFGIGQWCLIVKGSHKDPSAQKVKLYLQGILMVRGNYVAEAVGEAELHSRNPLQSWASVWESAKSDCITRCCKDVGIASELWQPQFIEKWKRENAIQVWREKTGKKKDGTPGSFQWRKKTSVPFYDEKQNTQETNTNNHRRAPINPLPAPAPLVTNKKPFVTEPIKKIKECSTMQELTELYVSMPLVQQEAEHILSYFTKQKAILKTVKK